MHTILLVEQDPIERSRLVVELQAAGYRVQAVETAAEARTSTLHSHADLAIVSNSAADNVDIELIQWLRGQPSAYLMPILALSTDASVHARLSALASGANDHVAWPFAPQHVLNRINSLLNQRDHLPSVAPQGFARRILVVDDSPTYGHALMEELQKDGHDVALAETGSDALRYVERHRADLIVLDVFLPDINGVEVCRRVKASPRTASLPILMLTGREKSAIRGEAALARADDFAVKSRDLEGIRSKVRLLLVRNPARTNFSNQLEAVTGGVGMPYGANASLREGTTDPSVRPRGNDQNRSFASSVDAGPASRPSAGRKDSLSEPRRTISGSMASVSTEPRRSSSGKLPVASPAEQRRNSGGMPVAIAVASGAGLSSGRIPTAIAVDAAGGSMGNSGTAASLASSKGQLRGGELFAQIVQGTGLSELLARSTVESICRRLDVSPRDLGPEDVPRLVEGLERTLQLFLPPAEAKARLSALSSLGQ
ncbi:MAG TPA: response regulator [Polyangiaceae bacterium]|nr:response regulator [Polyangiaceae bacterium]